MKDINSKIKNFPTKKYKVIYADPPWKYQNMGNIQGKTGDHYESLSFADLVHMPVNKIADSNCILFMWVTFPKLQEGLDLIHLWGFRYVTVGFNWFKTNKDETPFFGVGWYTKSNSEICLIGVKGKAPKISNSISNVVVAEREQHSKKPDIVREKIVEFCGKVPRIELFARQKTKGWDVWGDQL